METILHKLRVHQIELEMQNEELRAAQAELAASRAHYFDLYDLAPVGYLTVSEPGIILEANLSAASLLRVDRAALMNEPISRFILKEDQDSFYRQIKQPLETGWPTCDLRMVKSDGTTFWAHLKKVSACDENGAPQCRIVFSDITWRKQAEEKIRSLNADLSASEDRLRELNALGELLMPPNPIEEKFKHITDTVVRVFRADFARIWIIKPGDRCQTGCAHAQVAEGPHMCRFRDKCLHLLASSGRYTHTDGGAHARVPFGCYKIGKIATGEEAGFLTNEVTADPRVHDHAWAKELGLKSFAGYCLIDAASTPVGVMALFSKQVIPQKHDLLLCGFAHLAALTLIAGRAEEELRKKTAEMEQFTSLISHDLKSPLVTIKTFLGFLEKDLAADKAASVVKDLAYIHGAADKMERLLNELLEFVRIGHARNAPEAVPLQEIVNEVAALVAGQIVSKGVPIEITREPVWLHGDRVRLVQIFQNLVDNAVKFLGDQPDPRIEIGAELEGGEIVLFVRDNGKGIDLRHSPKLFGLFEKLDPNTPGSGIGLAMVRRIVEAHGGRIRAESDGPGKGTTFRFTLAKTELRPA